MGRTRRISKEAKATTISLTTPQQIAFQKLQIKRQEAGRAKQTLTETMLEGFQIILSGEDFSDTELERIFPKVALPKAPVHVMSRKRRT